MIEITAEQLDRVSNILRSIPGGAEKAIRNALPRAVSHLRTQTTKRVTERYAIASGDVRANENIGVRYSYHNGGQATILFSGAKIPLYRYSGSSPKYPQVDKEVSVPAIVSGEWKQVHPGVPGSGHQLKSTSSTRFEDSFVAMMRSGHTGIFERSGGRTASGASSIQEIMGSSVPQMVGSREVLDKLEEDAQQKLGERIEHEITRILNGYGG